MRALALTESKAFSALIFLLSLGPLTINAVRILVCLWECTHAHYVPYTHADRFQTGLDSDHMSPRYSDAWHRSGILQSKCLLGELIVLSVFAGINSCKFLNRSRA